MKNFLKKYVLNNIWLKLISVVVAVLCWCAVMNRSDPYMTVTIRNITVNKLNEDAVTSESMLYEVTSGDTINITCYGPRSEVQNLKADDVNAYVDLEEISLTESCPIHVEFVDKDATNNVEVTSKSAETMQLSLEKMVTESKQVICETKGTAASGYYAVAEVSPATIDVYGSSNAVEAIASLKAEIDISDVSESFEQTVSVVAINADGEELTTDVTFEVTSVTVSVIVYPTKTINVNLDYNVSAGTGFLLGDIKYAPTSITIAGEKTTIASITDITIAYENTEIIESVNENISLTDYLPEGVYLASNTTMVSVTIPVSSMDENKTLTTTVNSLDTSSLTSSLKVNNSTDVLALSVWGVEGSTDSITAAALDLSVDLSGVTAAGNYEVEIVCGNEKFMIDPVTVEIEVIAAGTEAD